MKKQIKSNCALIEEISSTFGASAGGGLRLRELREEEEEEGEEDLEREGERDREREREREEERESEGEEEREEEPETEPEGERRPRPGFAIVVAERKERNPR